MGIQSSLTGLQVDMTTSQSSNGRPQVDIGQQLILGPNTTFEVIKSSSNGDGQTVGLAAEVDYAQVGTSGGLPLYSPIRQAVVIKNIAAVAVTAGTPVTVWTPAAGKKFRILGFHVSLSVAGSVLFKDATVEFIRSPLMGAGVGQTSLPLGNGYISTAANAVLAIDASASGSVSGYVIGVEE